MKYLSGRLTAGDCCLMAVLLLAALIAWPLACGSAGARVIAEQQGRVVFTAPLHTRRQVSLQGPAGLTVLLVDGGRVRVLQSSCPQHLCQRQGAISRQGETLVCLPNRLLVRITGSSSSEKNYDFLSR